MPAVTLSTEMVMDSSPDNTIEPLFTEMDLASEFIPTVGNQQFASTMGMTSAFTVLTDALATGRVRARTKRD